jgi:hypothetical protein
MSICRNNHSRNSFNNYYNNLGNMSLWYDCSDKTTLLKTNNSTVTSNGDFVKTIKNKAPKYANNFNLTQNGTDTNTYDTSLTKPSVLTSNVLNSGFYTVGSSPMNTEWSIFMVYKPTASTVCILTKTGESPNQSIANPIDFNGIYRKFGTGISGQANTKTTSYNVSSAQTTPILFVAKYTNGTSCSYSEYINGTAGYTFTSALWYGDSASTPLYIGNRSDNVGGSMYLCEFILYNTIAISDNARVYLEGYLASKWGIQSLLPANHTYKATIPPLLPNSYTTLNTPFCWYDTVDISTLLNSSNNVINGTNGEYITTIKNKAPNYKNTYNLVSLSSTANSYNTTLSKPSILTNPVISTGFKTDSNMLIPSGYTAIMVYKPTGNVYTGTTSTNFCVMTKTTQNYATPMLLLGVQRFIASKTLNNYTVSANTYNLGTATSTPILYVSQFNTTTNTYNEYINGTTGITFTSPYYSDVSSPLYIANREDLNVNCASMYLCEFFLYSSSINDTSRVYLEGYLASKWGIQSLLPAGHTYKSSTPPLTPDKYSVS